MKLFLMSMVAYSVIAGSLLCCAIPSQWLNVIQIVASLTCNYANVPQIVHSFRTKTAAWSRITSAMSIAGNLIR